VFDGEGKQKLPTIVEVHSHVICGPLFFFNILISGTVFRNFTQSM
jgi:hypothetical protein